MGAISTVWEIDWEGKGKCTDGIHPTQKPLRIFEIPMEQHTKRGDVVLEPFSGSGSQIMAAERIGRRCFAMELSPTFVDAAILRWQAASGEQAALDSTGELWDDRAQESRQSEA